MQLTEHFSLREFTRSATAEKYHIDNTPDSRQIANLKNLCEQVLEPLRQEIQKPLIISSGYRCPALNARVGGKPNSKHLTGEAADLRIQDLKESREWIKWMMDNTDFDQIILETKAHRTYWIHVSCLRDRSKNRHEVIPLLVK